MKVKDVSKFGSESVRYRISGGKGQIADIKSGRITVILHNIRSDTG